MKTPLEAAINPQKKKTVTRVVNAELLFFELIKSNSCLVGITSF